MSSGSEQRDTYMSHQPWRSVTMCIQREREREKQREQLYLLTYHHLIMPGDASVELIKSQLREQLTTIIQQFNELIALKRLELTEQAQILHTYLFASSSFSHHYQAHIHRMHK